MGLFKPDLYRSLAIGFVLGAAIVFSVLGIDPGSNLANGVAPAAEAAPAEPKVTLVWRLVRHDEKRPERSARPVRRGVPSGEAAKAGEANKLFSRMAKSCRCLAGKKLSRSTTPTLSKPGV